MTKVYCAIPYIFAVSRFVKYDVFGGYNLLIISNGGICHGFAIPLCVRGLFSMVD